MTCNLGLLHGARAKAGLNKAIAASCWTQFATRLTDKANRTPDTARCQVVPVPAFFTSLRCHHCGETAPENRNSQAVFRCVRCGHSNHADTNAAENLLDRALSIAAGQAAATTPSVVGDGRNSGKPAHRTTTASTTQQLIAA